MMSEQPPKVYFNIGQNIDVKDSVGKWVNGEIIYIKGQELYVHYSGWRAKYDEYIHIDSNRILIQWEPGKQLQINNRVDAYHPIGGWLEARVIDRQQAIDPITHTTKLVRVKVHFFNYHSKYDLYLQPHNPSSIGVIGSRSNAYGLGKCRLKSKASTLPLSQLAKKLLEVKVKNMVEELKEKNMIIKEISGDGNCLFRSISHQLYGREDYHAQIRQICMKYILSQRFFFQDYVIEDIDSYVKRKSVCGIWGDDVEIEALSQIYGRPIQIYATSCKPLRTFHEDNNHNIQPLKLAYVGYCHYNSINHQDQVDEAILDTEFGHYESLFFAAYQNRNIGQQNEILRYRDLFAHTNPLEYAFQEGLEADTRKDDKTEVQITSENLQFNKILELSQTQNILDQIQKSQMKQLQNTYEQQMLQEQIKKIQEKEIELAKQLSKKIKKQQPVRPYWFADLLSQGFTETEILFGIQMYGFDPDAVQNYLLDNM